MAGIIPIGELTAASDLTTGALVDRPSSQTQQAVDRRIAGRVPIEMAKDGAVRDALLAGVSDAVQGMNLLEATHGVADELVDMDLLRTSADIGFRTVRYNNLLNAPEGVPGNDPICNIEIYRNASNAVTQRLTAFGGSWVRSANGNDAFYAWRRVLEDSDLPVVSDDPFAPLEDGQSLYVIDPLHAGSVWPSSPFEDGAGWSYPWGTDRLSKVQWLPREDGRGELQMLNGSDRRVVTWDRFDNTLDVDVSNLMLASYTSGNFGSGVTARVSGDHDSRTAIIAGLVTSQANGPELIVFEFNDAASRIIGRTTFQHSGGDEVRLRLRVIGNQAWAKGWQSNATEPDEWMVTGNTEILTPGRAGLYLYAYLVRFRALEVEAL